MVVTVFLKEKGSEESKPVDTSHEETGNSLPHSAASLLRASLAHTCMSMPHSRLDGLW